MYSIEEIKQEVKKQGYTQEEFGAKLGLSRIAIGKVFNGKVELTMKRYRQILEILGIECESPVKKLRYPGDVTKNLHLGHGNINNSVNRVSGNNNITGSGISTGNVNFSGLHESTPEKMQNINIPILTQNNLFEFAHNKNGLKSSSLQTISLAINDCFLLGVVDDTMENDAARVSLKQGDLLLSQINTKPSNGNIVIVKLLKRNQIAIAVYNDHLLDGEYLSFLNPRYSEHKITDDFEVIAIGMAKYVDLMRC